ncbi:MAG: response regulator transcription factor [Bdellovibrionales bacterium]|nr:response regulator transcription factor [Bdellovibrionales bacterium]
MLFLLVEDDPILGKSIKNTLELESYEVKWSQSVEGTKPLLESNEFQCMLLDIGLPDGNGISLCKELRNEFQKVPIIFLTAQTDEDSLLKAFEAGGTDFLRKPFSQKELLARIKAHTRNLNGTKSNASYRDLRIDLEKREAYFNDKKIELNNTEIQILYFLSSNAEKIITRDRLMEFLGKGNEIFDRTIDSHISHIRRQLKHNFVEAVQIKSVYGVGYKLEVSE